jgi:hypothetical protein
MVKKNGKEGYRSFTIEGSSISFEGGEFISKTPGGAASKVANKLYRLIYSKSEYARYRSDGVVQFIIREKTQGSAHKTFAYDAKRTKLPTPIKREIPNKKTGKPTVYEITHKVKVKALKESEIRSGLKQKM